MASIKTVIDELETIANAFQSLKYFNYLPDGNLQAIDRSKEYPALIVLNRQPGARINLQTFQGEYRLTLHFYNTHQRSDTDSFQSLQADLELIALQYFRELEKRGDDRTKERFSAIASGNYAQIYGDKPNLIRLTFDLDFIASLDCTDGVFNY